MKTLEEIVRILRDNKERFRKVYKVTRMRIFGSYARGDQVEGSDLDIIVEFEEAPTLIEFIRFEQELEELLEMNVDLHTERSLSPLIKPFIGGLIEL